MKTKAFKKLAHKIKKYAPEIMTGVGAVCTVTGAVIACKQTLKLPNKVISREMAIDDLKDIEENQKVDSKEVKKQINKEKFGMITDIVELYALPIGLGALGLGLMIGSTRISRKRYTALTGAYMTLESAYKNYRDRVIEKYGEDEDRYFRTGVKTEKIERVDEDGKKVKEEVKTIDPKNPNFGSPYCFIFDENTAPNTYCKPSVTKGISPAFALDSNLNFLHCIENWVNDVLDSGAAKDNGTALAYAWENTVLKKLGMEEVDMGQDVGITYRVGDTFPNGEKKRFSLGIQVCKSPETYENIILLDMNFEGNIRDKVFGED